MKFKGIVHNILNDAPFIGGLVIANQCSKDCRGCFTQALKDEAYTIENSCKEIVRRVKSNGLNEGIILSGLEWSEKSEDLKEIVDEALTEALEVMIYTYHTEEAFFDILPELKKKPVHIKFGKYDEKQIDNAHMSMGVKLASSNQYIKYFGN